MSNVRYASGKHAFGFCDRCGFRYPYLELQDQIINENVSGLKVCDDCLDIDHEQLRLGETPILDPQSLEDPRPDIAQAASRSFFGWKPVGHPLTNIARTALGTVTIVIT